MIDLPRPGEVWYNKNGGRLFYFIKTVTIVDRWYDQTRKDSYETVGIYFRYLGNPSFIQEDQLDGFSYIEGFQDMGLERFS